MSSYPSTHQFLNTPDRGPYETDTRWTSVDKYTLSHLHPSTRPTHAILADAAEYAASQGLDDIACPPVVGKFLALQLRLLNVTHALEVGLLGGYSALWMLLENPQLKKLVTLEADPECARVARENFTRAGIAPERVEIILAPAAETMPKLHAEVAAGTREKFGFAFIDADKLNNYTYFDWAVQMSHRVADGTGLRSCIIVDNVVAKGQLANEAAAEGDTMVAGGRDVVEKVGKDDRVEATVLQVVSEKDYDGFLYAAVL